MVLSFGQMGEGPLRALWVLAGLVLALRASHALSARQAAWFGWAMGLAYFGITLRWIVEPFFVDPLRHGWMAPIAIVGLAGGLALFWAAAFGLGAFGARSAILRPVGVAAALIAAEFARAHVFSGFPWAMLSYSLIGGPVDYLFAVVGPHGASAVLVAVAVLASVSLDRGRTILWPGLAVICAGLVTASFATPMPGTNETAPRVRLVQPNAPQHLKWDPEWIPVFFERAIAATAADPPPDLVIWPETSVATLLRNADTWLAQIGRAGRGAPVLAGIQRWAPEAGYHNSAIVVETDGSVAALYDKQHLVPFGEYVPLVWIFGKIGLTGVVDMARGYAPGTGGGTLDVAGLGRARILICYEGIFPEEIVEGGTRPEVLVVMTNDAWFGTGPGPRQHLLQARARAIEQGLPVLRAANTGISAVIDARGRIGDSLPLGEAGYLDVRVSDPLPPTLYSRAGDWPVLAVLIATLGLVSVRRRRIHVDGDGAAH
ncbi:apolipoprotein N-acyltransferase [Salibaculum sp.]|uniref:apolipoprotein N-acyltransferase n=1 Tax=Salibaculum sp. TaxID=2855480 RepID=UPI002B46F8E5|nr:apolipoprotein N-acyltransferase [Salibaculum sp.]HKL70200.1 apolipoprotein N-acyltransferase [Salibaculum sp.]